MMIAHEGFRIRATRLVLLVASAFMSPSLGVAQLECDTIPPRGPVAITPAVGAQEVTLDAPIKVEYPLRYFESPSAPTDLTSLITVAREGTVTPIPGKVERLENFLFFIPTALEAETSYTGAAKGIDQDLNFSFHTGCCPDVSAPTLGGVTSVGASKVRESCEAPDGGYRIDVTFPSATDDGPGGSVEYLLYLTRGPSVDEPILESRVRNFTREDVTMAFTLSAENASSPICVAITAIDGVGKQSADDSETCFDPIQGNFFAPLCAVSAPGVPAHARSKWLLWGALCAASFIVWKRRADRLDRIRRS